MPEDLQTDTTSSADELVHLAVDRGVATITLDDPPKRNALSSRLLTELAAHLDRVVADDDVRAVVLTGTGTVFCAGADLSEAGDDPPVSFADVLTTLWELPLPVVGRCNGHARAGGIGILAACDLVVAPASATFAFTEVRIGVSPAMIAVPLLRTLSPRGARRYLLTGETFDAAVAAEIGLVTEVVDDAGLDDAVGVLADALRQGEPHALAVTRGLLRDLPALGFRDGLAHAAPISAELFRSEAAAEGIASFREKRAPRWAT